MTQEQSAEMRINLRMCSRAYRHLNAVAITHCGLYWTQSDFIKQRFNWACCAVDSAVNAVSKDFYRVSLVYESSLKTVLFWCRPNM